MKVSFDPFMKTFMKSMSWKELEEYSGEPASIPLVHDSTLPVDVFLEISRNGRGYVTITGDITDFGSTASELARDQVTSACDTVMNDASGRYMFDDTIFPEFGMTVYLYYGTMSPEEFLDTNEVKESLNRFEQYLSGNPFTVS